MLKVNSIQKYFNKNKQNEIHVINDINLEFPKTGLVCLLGPSGCGKTTLLNVMSGLDKTNSGEIDVLYNTFKKYKSDQWDMIRNRHFGYIFQNYYLLPDLTIYQNLEFVLKMLNLNKEETDRRIEYALSAVGMVKYKKRKPNQLSGGQQQRIAIARALVKSPDVIFADEPTGNLDEKNTLSIMNIIKKISEECLVVLVTHERRLADFYGDRIIELLDGKVISDVEVSNKTDLLKLDDNNIYLQEFNQQEINDDKINIKYFFDETKAMVDLNIIFKDNTFYIQSKVENVKIKFLDKTSEIKIIDSKKPSLKSENVEELDYYLEKLPQDTKSNTSVIKYKDTFKMALAHIGGLSRKQKFLFLVFVLAAILVTIASVNLYSTTYQDESDFLTDNRQLIQVKGINTFDYDDILDLKNKYGEYNVLAPASTIRISSLDFDLFKQANNSFWMIDNSVLPIEVLSNPKLIAGRLPEQPFEVVIDKFLVDSLFNNHNIQTFGFNYPEQLVGITYFNNKFQQYFEIVGIVDTNNPNFYMTNESYQTMVINFYDNLTKIKTINNTNTTSYYLLDDYKNELNDEENLAPSFNISQLELKDNEILVNKGYYETRLGTKTEMIIRHQTFNIVGVYDNIESDVIISSNAVDKLMFQFIYNENELSIYSTNLDKTISEVTEMDLQARSVYRLLRERNAFESFSLVQYTFAIIILVASFIFLYFIMRSSLIARVYQIGVYRALGVKRSNIHRLFISEIILITVLTSLIGILIVSWFINGVNSMTPFQIVLYPWFLPVLSFGFLLTSNLIVGLLPVFNLLRLTPSQILSKYDI